MLEMLATMQELMELYREAMNFERLAIKQWLKPGQLIVFQDQELDMMGFCSLDKERQLNVYLEIEGLKGYLETLSNGLLLSRQTCLTLSFKNMSDLDIWDCEQIASLELDTTINKAWPKFRYFLAGFLPEPIKEKKECKFLTRILKQLNLMEADNENFSLLKDELPLYVHINEGKWNTLKAPMSIFLEQVNQNQFFYTNELETYRINRLPVGNMVFEVGQFFLPQPVKDQIDCRGFFPLVTAVFESETKYLIFGDITDCTEESQVRVLDNFARMLSHELKFKPKCLVTNSQTVVNYYQDFCTKTNIELELVSGLESAEELMEELLDEKIYKATEALATNVNFDEEIDVILNTAKEICKKILNSNLLNSKLAEEAKNHFTAIIELIHVVMLGNFRELPDCWTANNMEYAYNNILPSLLSEHELKYVPDIIFNYVDIVGEAEVLPNYREIKHCMELIKE